MSYRLLLMLVGVAVLGAIACNEPGQSGPDSAVPAGTPVAAAPEAPADQPARPDGTQGTQPAADEKDAERAGGRPRLSDRLGFNEQKQAEILAFTAEHFPEELDDIRELKDTNVNEYRRALQSKQRLMKKIARQPKHLKAAYIAKNRAHRNKWRAVVALRQARTPAEKKECRERLRKAIAEYFDADLTIDAETVDRFEQRVSARVKQLRADLEDRIRNREQRIEQRFQYELRRMEERAKLAKRPASTRPADESAGGDE